jgi:DNA recombination protein RmuC
MTQAPDVWMILFLLAAAAAGYLFWQGQQRREGLSPADQHKLHAFDGLAAERDSERARADDLAIKLAAETARAGEREQALIQASQTLEKTFESVAARALGQSQQNFLTLAKETFEKHEKAAAGGVEKLVSPVQEQFIKLSDTIAKMEQARTADKSTLTEQVKNMSDLMKETRTVTGKLANALRAGPKTRGRWGEETLKNVLELSGLSQRIDFSPEHTVQDGEGGRLRPDVKINLPGGRCIVVDSKVALSGYLDALEATDDAAREILLKKHAQELRNHMKLLSGKEYWRHLPATADFVVMFVPGDNFIAAAFEQDPDLYQDAFVSKVVIIGPANLFALAKTIAYGWRQEETEKNAEEIAALGRELYTRLSTLSEKIGGVGGSLEKSLKSYNELVATFDSRFVPQARKFKELGVAEGAPPAEPKQIDVAPRLPAPQGELDFGGPGRLKRSG